MVKILTWYITLDRGPWTSPWHGLSTTTQIVRVPEIFTLHNLQIKKNQWFQVKQRPVHGHWVLFSTFF